MTNKFELASNLKSLLASAQKRNVNQGVKVYEILLEKLDSDLSQDEINDIYLGLERALAGIEAHGYFTTEEYNYISTIRAMK